MFQTVTVEERPGSAQCRLDQRAVGLPPPSLPHFYLPNAHRWACAHWPTWSTQTKTCSQVKDGPCQHFTGFSLHCEILMRQRQGCGDNWFSSSETKLTAVLYVKYAYLNCGWRVAWWFCGYSTVASHQESLGSIPWGLSVCMFSLSLPRSSLVSSYSTKTYISVNVSVCCLNMSALWWTGDLFRLFGPPSSYDR